MSRNNSKSDAFESIHASAEALHRTSVIDKAAMREFDASCLSPVRTTIPAKDSITKWRTDPAYVEAYDALAEEFSFASETIAARSPKKRGPKPRANVAIS